MTSPTLPVVRPASLTATPTPLPECDQQHKVSDDEARLMTLMETLLDYYDANSYRTMSEQMAETLTRCGYALDTHAGHAEAYTALWRLIRAERLYRYDAALREAVRNAHGNEVRG